jgi:hypothetical protein
MRSINQAHFYGFDNSGGNTKYLGGEEPYVSILANRAVPER